MKLSGEAHKRHRKPNWTDDEVVKMLEEISFEKTLLMSSFQNITRAKKNIAWDLITERINAVGGNQRDVCEVKKKWKDMKKAAIDRPNVMKKTGGGGKVPEVPYEGLIMDIVGTDTHLRSGIPGSQLTDSWNNTELEETDSVLLHETQLDSDPHHARRLKGRDSWCFYNRAEARGDPRPRHQGNVTTPINREVARQIVPVYRKLADPELLRRCLRGMTRNTNESLHGVIWSRCLKHTFASHDKPMSSSWLRTQVALLDEVFAFAAMRPEDILPSTSCRKTDCLCEYCANMDLKLEALRLFVAKKGLQGATHQDRHDLSRSTLCAKGVTGEYRRLCLDRACVSCGTTAIENRLQPLLETHTEEVIQYQTWGTVEEGDFVSKTNNIITPYSSDDDEMLEEPFRWECAICGVRAPLDRLLVNAENFGDLKAVDSRGHIWMQCATLYCHKKERPHCEALGIHLEWLDLKETLHHPRTASTKVDITIGAVLEIFAWRENIGQTQEAAAKLARSLAGLPVDTMVSSTRGAILRQQTKRKKSRGQRCTGFLQSPFPFLKNRTELPVPQTSTPVLPPTNVSVSNDSSSIPVPSVPSVLLPAHPALNPRLTFVCRVIHK
ncbi:hypothetical protein BaRGS_00020163 [Batillaria attramentaria]|uniref:Myb/SANT-like DNA-binding domain-containing protein n=1 Tax=Batillaria attramentaria TaxID=370345 RepID=A0ABD0KMS1_9CAEN